MSTRVFSFAAFAIWLGMCLNVSAQEAKTEFTMAEIAILDAIDGHWTLAEYNEDGRPLEWKRKLSKGAVIANGTMTQRMDIGGGNPPFEIVLRAETIDADLAHIQFTVSQSGHPAAIQWAKIEGDRILLCCKSDRSEDQNEIPREFKPREGLTLMIWTRSPEDK